MVLTNTSTVNIGNTEVSSRVKLRLLFNFILYREDLVASSPTPVTLIGKQEM